MRLGLRFGRFGAVAIAAGAGLACAGLGGGGGDAADGALSDAEADRIAEEVANARPVTVSFLAEDGDGARCAWLARTLPDGDDRVIGTISGPCPERWSAAVLAGGEAAAVYAPDGLWRFTTGGVTRVVAPTDAIALAAFDGGPNALFVCGVAADAVREPEKDGEERHIAWKLGGKTYRIELEGDAVDAELERSWRLNADGTWAVEAVAPVPLHEGVSDPACAGLPGWPTADTVALHAPDVTMRPEDWAPAADAALAELTPLGACSWSVRTSGLLAACPEGPDGSPFGAPAAWRKRGEGWSLVPGITEGAAWDARFAWLLTHGADGAEIRNLVDGGTAWSGNGVSATFWPEDVPVPSFASAPADAPEAEPEPEPAAEPEPAEQPAPGGGAPTEAWPHAPGAPEVHGKAKHR